MKKILLFLVSLLIGITLFVKIGQIVGWQEIKRAFLVFFGWQGLVILGLTLLIIMAGVWKWKEVLKSGGNNISFGNLLRIYMAGFTVGFLVPIILFGGEVFRAYILKERNSVAWPKGVASVIVDRVLEWTVNLIVIFFGLLFFFYKIGFSSKNLGIIFGGVLAIFVLGIGYFYLKAFKKESIIKIIVKGLGIKRVEQKNTFLKIEEEIFNFFRLQEKAMWKGFGLAFLRATGMYLRAWVLISFLGKSVGALSVLSILGFSHLALLIPIPTALGSHEAIQALAFSSLGLGASSATAFAMIIRGAEIIVALVGIIILIRLGIVLLRSALLKKIDSLV